ncbi:asparagine synthetase B [Conexivisphaera calida]|uniref:Asparagine synthetase B n=1 Tax=Conexivisphaera calida TaxID=1874277 RepID=A0A4P2VEA5_9ARCH|nr:asparagine synthetase B [Conexivisphaera calida]
MTASPASPGYPGIEHARDINSCYGLFDSGFQGERVCGFVSRAGSGDLRGRPGSYSYVARTDKGVEASREIWSPYPVYTCSGARVTLGASLPGCRLLAPGSHVLLTDDGVEYSREFLGTASSSTRIEELVESLARALTACHRIVACGSREIAIAFSGGLDSSLLAHMSSEICGQSVVLYTVTDDVGRGLDVAMEAADVLGLPLRVVRISEKYLHQFQDVLFSGSVMDAALSIGFSSVAAAARADGHGHLVLGQLADELFGGYHRYLRLHGSDLESAMRLGLEASSESLVRDFSAVASRGVMPLFPYTCNEIVRSAIEIPVDLMVLNGVRKYPLRMAALALGMPERLAMREKRAFQYSSGLERLVRAIRRGVRRSRAPEAPPPTRRFSARIPGLCVPFLHRALPAPSASWTPAPPRPADRWTISPLGASAHPRAAR